MSQFESKQFNWSKYEEKKVASLAKIALAEILDSCDSSSEEGESWEEAQQKLIGINHSSNIYFSKK